MESPTSAADFLKESRSFEQAGNFAAAIQRARLALEAAQLEGNHEAAGQAMLACAQAFFRLGNYEETERLSRLALEQVGAESDARVDGFRILGICALETNHMAAGEDYLRQAIALSRQIGNDFLLARGLHNLSAGVYAPRGQFDLSLQADLETLRICRERGYSEISWAPLLTMSWVHWLTGRREACQKCLAELEQEALPGSLACGYVHLLHAQLALDRNRQVESEPDIEAVLSIGERLGSPELRVLGRLARSRRLRLGSELAAAVAWAEDAHKIAADIGYHHLEGMALIELGRGVWGNHNFKAAEGALRTAIDILDPLELRFDAARAGLFLAGVMHDQGSQDALAAWQAACARLLDGGFVFLLAHEEAWAGRLVACYELPGGALMQHFRRIPPAPLRIVTCGGLRVWVGEREVDRRDLHRRRAGELLALLLLAPGHSLPVEQVIEALFPGKQVDPARDGFHQATSTLRHVLEPDLPEKFSSRYLEIDDGQAEFRLPAGSQIDLDSFFEQCHARRWKPALELAEGEFLPEMLYAEWAALPRQRFNNAVQQALLELARECLVSGQYAEAVSTCRRLLGMEPWHEQAVLLGMEACHRLGDRAGARRLYRQLEKTLETDLGSLPSEEVQAYYRALDRRITP